MILLGSPTEIPRTRYVSQWASGVFQFRGNRISDSFAAKGGAHIRSAIIRQDQNFLKSRVERIKDFVDEHVAHRALFSTRPPNFAALDVGLLGGVILTVFTPLCVS